MYHFADKIILYFCSALFYVQLTGINTQTVVVLLLAILLFCFDTVWEQLDFLFRPQANLSKDTRLYEIIYGGFVISLFLKPELSVFLPVIFYDSFRHRQKIAPVLAVFLLLIRSQSFSLLPYIILILLCCFAGILTLYATKTKQLSEELIAFRDTSVEHERLIESNNKMLLEKQDSAIYTATLKERNRIAREIHDNVGHLITRSILQTGAIKTINQNETLKMPIEMLNETLNTAMTSIRNSVHDLHDESIDLRASIEEITATAEKFQIHIDYDMGKEISKNVKYAFISITKEAVNNAVKYSNGDTIHIKMREHPAFYQLMIEDNGNQIDLSNHSGIGLNNIKERANAIHGNAKFFTDNGFRILVTVPKEENK